MSEKKPRRLATIAQVSELYPAFGAQSIRWLIYKNTNDISKCLVRIGRRIYMDCALFENWLDSQATGGK
jgi:hypothetical protein